MIALQPFCSTQHFRQNLWAPWSAGEWTYATNGVVMIRVPRRPDVEERANAPRDLSRITIVPDVELTPIAMHAGLLTAQEIECPDCYGSGSKAPCGCDCRQCECEECDGEGSFVPERERYCRLRGATFTRSQLALLLPLQSQNLHAPATLANETANYFRADGAEVWIMGCRNPDRWSDAERHKLPDVEILNAMVPETPERGKRTETQETPVLPE